MKRILLGSLLLAAVPALALASDQGVYLAADIGAAQYKGIDPFPNPGKVGLNAGYRFGKNFAAELGFTYFGKSTVDIAGFGSTSITAYSFYPSLVGILPITQEFSAFGKLGISSNHAEQTGAGGDITASAKAPYFGLGVEYLINPKLGFRALYENFGKFESGSDPMKASAFSLGIIVYLQ